MSNLDPKQDKTNDTGVVTPTPTTGTDQPTVVPTDKPVDQPEVTPDPASTIPEPAKPTETPEPAPTIPEPKKEEGEGAPPAAA